MNPPKAQQPFAPRGSAKAAASVKGVRIGLGVAGAGLIGYGLMGLPTQLGPSQLLGLLTWLAVAVLLHDGVIVPLSTLAGAGLTRLGSGLRPVSAAVLRGALMTGAIVTLITGILLKAQSVARNTTVLEADYAGHLLWFWTLLAIAAAAAIYACERSGGTTPGTRETSKRPGREDAAPTSRQPKPGPPARPVLRQGNGSPEHPPPTPGTARDATSTPSSRVHLDNQSPGGAAS